MTDRNETFADGFRQGFQDAFNLVFDHPMGVVCVLIGVAVFLLLVKATRA